MANFDPLQSAAAAYAADRWDDENWRQFGRETGTSDILSSHPRLYRSLGFGDPDYPDAAVDVLGRVLKEATDDNSGQRGRMALIADSMPDLPSWITEHAPNRTKRLFTEYLAGRDLSEIPEQWLERHNVFEDYKREPTDLGDPISSPSESRSSAIPTFGTSREAVTDADAPPEAETKSPGKNPPALFIVHGHDEAALNSVRIYVHKRTGIMPISLAEEAGKGATIIEKFEEYGAKASFVIVLLTPDDVGHTVAAHQAGSAPNPRARQNVVLELGYFIGKIGRGRIIVVDADVERPSDLAGLSYVAYPGTNWKDDLRVELEAREL
jgi:predicted nucleotide-binding protein